MDTYPVVIVAAGDNYLEEIGRLPAVATLAEAIESARAAGYTIPDDLADAAGAKRQAAAEAKARQRIKDQAEAKALWQKLTPAWAKAAIIAEYREDKSDLQSDYWGSASKKTVLLGFSKSTRDGFKEMRRFAATYEPTQSLATAGPAAEHREKYSMGAGYYLKAGGRHATGWEVRKLPFYRGNLPFDVVDFSQVAK